MKAEIFNLGRHSYLSLVVRKPVFGIPDQVRHKVDLQKIARGLKFRISIEEELYYPCSENKGADLRLCFRICKKPVFSRRGSFHKPCPVFTPCNRPYTSHIMRKLAFCICAKIKDADQLHCVTANLRKTTMWLLTRPNTNQAVQLQKMARGLKFRI